MPMVITLQIAVLCYASIVFSRNIPDVHLPDTKHCRCRYSRKSSYCAYTCIGSLPKPTHTRALTNYAIKGGTFTKLPAYSFIGSSTWISLSHTRIRSIHSKAFRRTFGLQELSITYSRLYDLPGGVFGSLVILKTLILSHNSIVRLRGAWFGVFAEPIGNSDMNYGVKVYDVSSNRLRELRNADLVTLPALRTFLASGNMIHSVGDYAFSSNPDLAEVDLSNNRLKSIHRYSFGHLVAKTSLKYLALQRNPLECNCHLKWIQNIVFNNTISKPTGLLEKKRLSSIFNKLQCKINDNTLHLWCFIIPKEKLSSMKQCEERESNNNLDSCSDTDALLVHKREINQNHLSQIYEKYRNKFKKTFTKKKKKFIENKDVMHNLEAFKRKLENKINGIRNKMDNNNDFEQDLESMLNTSNQIFENNYNKSKQELEESLTHDKDELEENSNYSGNDVSSNSISFKKKSQKLENDLENDYIDFKRDLENSFTFISGRLQQFYHIPEESKYDLEYHEDIKERDKRIELANKWNNLDCEKDAIKCVFRYVVEKVENCTTLNVVDVYNKIVKYFNKKTWPNLQTKIYN